MKKKLIDRLEEVAKQLPEVFEMKPAVIPGEVMKQHYKKAKPNALYTRNIPQPVNHLKKLKAAYKLGGDDAVAKYSAEQHILAGKQRIEQKQQQEKQRKVQTI